MRPTRVAIARQYAGPLVSLQIGRGLAAMAVAMFHLAVLMQAPAFGSTHIGWLSIFSEGHLGVDFFFVLSGFIILHAHEADIGSDARLARYVYRRAVRIYPIYWLYLCVCIAGMLAVHSAHLQLSSVADWASAFSLLRFSTVELPLQQAWTLFHEALFYGMFALLVAHRQLGAAAMLVWFGAVAVIDTRYPATGESFAQVLTSAANLNFLAGMAAYKAMSYMTRPLACAAIVAGLTLLLAGAWQYGIAFALLLTGAATLERPGLPKWTGFIGDASYSIYLLHEHVESYSARALAKLGILPATRPVLMFLIVMTIVLLVGCVAYVAIEKPLVGWFRRREPA